MFKVIKLDKKTVEIYADAFEVKDGFVNFYRERNGQKTFFHFIPLVRIDEIVDNNPSRVI